MPQARHQASLTPDQRHSRVKGGKEGGQWPLGHSRLPGPLPHRAGEGRRGHRECARPRLRSSSAGGPVLGAGDVSHRAAGSTETSPPTPPPAESWEDAELGLRSGGHRPGQGQGGRLWAKFCVATGGGVGKAKPRLAGFPIRPHSASA